MMATIAVQKRIVPQYKGTVVCQACGAEYKPGNWKIGVYERDTTSDFHLIGSLERGRCPICREPEENPS